MHTKVLTRLVMIAMFITFPHLFGQQHPACMPREQRTVLGPDYSGPELCNKRSVFDQPERMFLRDSPSPQPSDKSPAGTVSVDQLRHPLSGQGKRLIEEGQKFAKKGDHEKAIEAFKAAINEPTAARYAHALLGTEYLKTGDPAAAITELTEAVRLMPGEVANRSNLGYAFLLTGQRVRAERELREAIKLDHVAPRPRYLMGLLLLDQRSPDAGIYLRFADKVLRGANLALAVFHTRHGEANAAQQNLRDYLGAKFAEERAGFEQWVGLAAQMERPSILFGFPAEAP